MAVCCVLVLDLSPIVGISCHLLTCVQKNLKCRCPQKYFYDPFYSRQLWNFHFLESRNGKFDVSIICSGTVDWVFCRSHFPQNSGFFLFQVLASMLPNRIVESCHKIHVPMSSWCVLSDEAIHIHVDYGQVCRVGAHAPVCAAVYPSCEHPHSLLRE